MNGDSLERKLNKKLQKHYGTAVRARIGQDAIRVSGTLSSWTDIVAACSMCVQKGSHLHVVNDIVLDGVAMPKMREPSWSDEKLEGRRPDVLVIGGGISGASIARELSKWKLDILLVEKEADLAVQASGRNDGEVHPGVDLNKGTLKQHYVLLGNKMYGKICRELDVPFERCGQYVGFTRWWMYPAVLAYVWHRKFICKVTDTVILGRKELRRKEKELNPKIYFAMYNPSAGCVCPYGLTIAYGENAAENGAQISLNTAVLGMEVKEGQIESVQTNRGRVYPAIVINAAGTFAEDIAAMADDRFYSIHPRKGTNSILDKKAGHIVKGIASVKTLKHNPAHTKGGGILHTVHGNLLVGPNAEETYEKENFATRQESIDAVFAKQKMTAGRLDKKDIITYFTGVRPATYEEDFIIEKGRRTQNLIHCAGIQSPGLTAAPAAALDVEKMAVEELRKKRAVEQNDAFNPIRKGIPVLKDMPKEERDRMIRKNPDYGIIVCRCEEISKGEILDALKSPVAVPTVDGIKKRLRPGMGRCQGGFCLPLVMDIISEYLQLPPEDVTKAGAGSAITYGRTKGAGQRRRDDGETI
ncbi:NAD(P)/FAD-dependent oxidoreductase [Dorea sp. D27]|uniref:NAD(P)/FAD-dependent oxidoreductase n=1 Tax=Dorea sp. D27 TaxID=658665 RepID=UPI000673660C|nr:NAD(P)/FAD-dependent oxidoreductase [Dorea sp. D27]KMZ55119.1 oxidoreductase, FAD-dependent [Dorea sp. D27]